MKPHKLKEAVLLWSFLLIVITCRSISLEVNNPNSHSHIWKAGEWSKCLNNSACGFGNQKRAVTCKSAEGLPLPETDCNIQQRPHSSQECFRVCQEQRQQIKWMVSRWSPCTPIRYPVSSCYSVIPGSAHRKVQCVHQIDDGPLKEIDDSACKYFWEEPLRSVACSCECPQNCIMTVPRASLSLSLSSCNPSSNNSDAHQRILVAPEPGGKDCYGLRKPPPFVYEECEKAVDNFTEQYFLKIGNWGPCLPPEGKGDTEFMDLNILPRTGLTRRNITCLNFRGDVVNISHCSEVPENLQVQRCVVSSDCELFPWSEWRILKEGCMNSKGQVDPEIRVRTRTIVKPAFGNGLPCGPMSDKRVVTGNLQPCNKYKWLPLEWGECVVYSHDANGHVHVHNPTCGGGVQTRSLICVRTTDSVPVHESRCGEPNLPVVQRCEIPCIRDCQVSHWSQWSKCLPTKNITDFFQPQESGYRKRTRSVIVSPTEGGMPCPHLEEADTCWDVKITEWHYGNWSECISRELLKSCGNGEMTRDYSCFSWDGKPLSEFFCQLHVPPMEKAVDCRVPCPNDCVYTEWSDWSTCSSPCSTDGRPGFSTRTRTLLAIPGENGYPCDLSKKQKKFCNMHSCSLIHWTTSEWSKCKIQPRSNDPACGDGIQTREVHCRRGSSNHKDSSICQHLDRPPEVRKCHNPCAVDCALTKFSDWSSCPESCPGGSSHHRHRYVIRKAKHDGKPCSELEENKPCPNDDDQFCLKKKKGFGGAYRWLLKPWGDCQLPSLGDRCGTGFQVRSVACIDDQSSSVEIRHCMKDEHQTSDFTVAFATVPTTFQLCRITCLGNEPSCVISAWSQWSPCSHRNKATRKRTRELIGKSANDRECKARFSLLEDESCPYLSDTLNEGAPWTSCLVDANTSVGINGETVKYGCGMGNKYRAGLQLMGKSGIEPGLEKDVCMVNCPVDCKMSEWSAWSDCDIPCGQGYRERTRSVLIPANEMGRPCPAEIVNGTETQSDVCGSPCSEYSWMADRWSKCRLHNEHGAEACGEGTQGRTVRCIDKRTGEHVDNIHCDLAFRPESSSNCSVFCPGKCVVSSWAIWKHCSSECRLEEYQEKRRRILRRPSLNHDCRPLEIKEPCVCNVTSFKYSYKVGEWGSCVLPVGAICGEGVQRRALTCIRSDNKQVDGVHCEKKYEPNPYLKMPMSKPCYTDCPIDCIVSKWSEWDDLQCNPCGNPGVKIRRRSVIQPASDEGQPCPKELEQHMACPYKPCFHWNISDWSSCDMQGADCGYGVRRRLVRCFRYDGLQVDKTHCLVANLTFRPIHSMDMKWVTLGTGKEEEEVCYVQCPGDCVLSQWSAWSYCHRDCAAGKTVGYQTSSRVVLKPRTPPNGECSSKLWRTRPCWDLTCVNFTLTYLNDTIVCQSPDGLPVSGGCESSTKPCFPGCQSRFGGKCDVSQGLCYCELENGKRFPMTDIHLAMKCDVFVSKAEKYPPKRPANHSAPSNEEIQLKYYPDDNQVSFWMYAMISIGTAFVFFVALTVYLMCRSSIRRRIVSVQRQGSVRRRGLSSPDRSGEPSSYA